MDIKKPIAIIQELHDELITLVETAQNSGDTDSGFERLRRWKKRAAAKIASEISPIEGSNLTKKQKYSFRMGDPIGNLIDEAGMYEGFLIALKDEIEAHPEDVLKRPVAESSDTPETIEIKKPIGKGVFLVHGHDELNLYRLKDALHTRYSLDPIVLSAEPGKGRTLIEKFEDEAQRAAYAFVLLTPDDVIKKSDTEYSQARPNVIFELGWFYGRLGRGQVCILFKKGTQLHSDLDGISRIEFKESVLEKMHEIETELISGKLLKKA
jgi:predicted nucleotide-binding protein